MIGASGDLLAGSAAGQPWLQRGLTVLAATAIFTLGLWAWTVGIAGPYHFDDYVTPLNDPASQSLAAWREYLPVTLRPVTKLTYALEAEAGLDREPAPRRAVSLAFHAISAALLFLLMLRLVPGAGSVAAAFLAALWFIHPVHADNVLMLSGRTAVLSGMFLLAALVAAERSKSWLAALLFILACFSRETALAGLLPLAVLAASRPGHSWRSVARELIPTLVGAALVLAWIVTTPRYQQLAEFSLLGRPFWPSVTAQVGAVPAGLALLFNPSALSIDYGLPLPSKFSEPLFLLGVALYLGAGAGIVTFLGRSRAVAVGLAVWLAALLPTQSVVPKLDALTNRPLALALAGLLLAMVPLVVNVSRAWRNLREGAQPGSAARRAGAAGTVALRSCVLALVALLATSTARRAELFESEVGLWRDAAAKSHVNARPHLHYARLLFRKGEEAEARRILATAARIDPFSAQIAALQRAHPPIEVSR